MSDLVKNWKDFLKRVDASRPCHRCGGTEMAIIDGGGEFPLATFKGKSATTVPVVFIVCDRCGALTPHAVGALESFTERTKSVN